MTACPVCQRREPADGRTTCDPCLRRIDDDLARIAELTRLAAGWLNPASSASGNTSRPVPGSRPPLNTDALDAACGNDVLPVLESWEKLVREFFGYAPYGPASLARNSSVLADRMITTARRPGEAATSRGMDTATEER